MSENKMRLALEELLSHYLAGVASGDWGIWNPEIEPEVIAAREALSQRETQEPVALGTAGNLFDDYVLAKSGIDSDLLVYTSPPPAQVPSEWVEVIKSFLYEFGDKAENSTVKKARALLAKQET